MAEIKYDYRCRNFKGIEGFLAERGYVFQVLNDDLQITWSSPDGKGEWEDYGTQNSHEAELLRNALIHHIQQIVGTIYDVIFGYIQRGSVLAFPDDIQKDIDQSTEFLRVLNEVLSLNIIP